MTERTRANSYLLLFLAFLHCTTCDKCPEGKSVRHFDVQSETNPSVYDDLTTTEIQSVYDYMTSRPEFGARDLSSLTVDSTYVYHIERLSPAKREVLRYLHDGGEKPGRFALVVMYRGDLSPPVIEEYKVGPLPDIEGYELLMIQNKTSVDYYKRFVSAAPDLAGWVQVIMRETAKVDHLLALATGGYTFNNCSDKCLTFFPGLMGEFKSEDRSIWIFLLRAEEGYVLHPIGLEFRVNATGRLNPDDWDVNFVYFRGETWENFDEMASSYTPPTQSDPPVETDTKQLYSTINQRGDPIPEAKQRGPVSFMPDGRRFSVDGHHVKWQGWEFDFNMRSIIGLQVHDARFQDERVAYELSLSEIGIVYSGASPSPMHSAFIDSPFGFGIESYDLVQGIDCPDHATFFDFAHYLGFKPAVLKKSACLFEHKRGLPIRRHYETDFAGSYQFIQGMPDNVLILRAAMAVYNYEYILDYTFHQNGVIETTVSLSGYILSSYYTGKPQDNSRGFQVFPDGLGQIHNHLIHFKVDLDVGRPENRFESLDIKIDRVQDPARDSEWIYVQKFDRQLRESEKNATYKFDFDNPKYLLVVNDDAENSFGNKKAYRVMPASMSKQLLPEDWAVEKGMSWARYQVAVTRQKDSEERGSSVYNLADNIDPVVNFQNFIDDDESLVDEDLVAWVTLGAFHIPHSEDIPIVQTPGVSLTYFLTPFNFFDEDPSLASRDNIRVTPGSGGSANFEYVGVSPDVTCGPGTGSKTSGAAGGTIFSLMFATMSLLAGSSMVL